MFQGFDYISENVFKMHIKQLSSLQLLSNKSDSWKSLIITLIPFKFWVLVGLHLTLHDDLKKNDPIKRSRHFWKMYTALAYSELF